MGAPGRQTGASPQSLGWVEPSPSALPTGGSPPPFLRAPPSDLGAPRCPPSLDLQWRDSGALSPPGLGQLHHQASAPASLCCQLDGAPGPGEAHAAALSPRAHHGSSASGSPRTQKQAPTSRRPPPVPRPPGPQPPVPRPPGPRPPAPWPPIPRPPILQPPVPPASRPLASSSPPTPAHLQASRPLASGPSAPSPSGLRAPSLQAPSIPSTAPSELPKACRLLSACGQPTAAQSPAPPSAACLLLWAPL